ncbi:hypothetical protein R1sor_015134 [Riccia sorocarpa]|uniref:Uncharacterized protein n=1 Tax=Riccia sorocarpa TaxID=122646 RepID=A0ABD3HEN6_9MARC
MGSQSRRQRTVDRKRTDQLGQSSRRIAQANEDRLRLRRQRYAEQQAKRRATSSSEPVASGSQRGIRRKVMEMVDKLKSLSGERTVKGTHTQDDVIAKKCALRMCSSKHIIDNRLGRQSSRCLKIAPRNIRIHANGMAAVLDENNTQIGKWVGVKPGRAQRLDRREFYELFMLSHSMVNVGGDWIPVRISQSMFCKLKPRWVKKEKDRNICCCRYHVELVNCKNMLNTLRKEHHAIHVAAEGSETEYWFRKACINLTCAQCGTRKFEYALCGVYEVADPVNSDTIKWEMYEYVGQGLKDEHGREKRRLELVFVETPCQSSSNS